MPQGEVVSVETSPSGERLSSAWKHRGDFGRQRRELPREDVAVDFVVEWQLQPLKTEAGSFQRLRSRPGQGRSRPNSASAA